MKNIILALLLVAPLAHASNKIEDRLEAMNKPARLVDHDTTILLKRAENCVKYLNRTVSDLEGFRFVVMNGRTAMSCQYITTERCANAIPFNQADIAVQDLIKNKLAHNSDIYQITKSAFAASGQCADEVKLFDKLVQNAQKFGAEFNKLKTGRPPVPATPNQD